jgi:hypothetical protein
VRAAGSIGPTLRIVAHTGVPGPAAFIAIGLFFVALGASYGCFLLFTGPTGALQRACAFGLGAVAVACFVLGTTLPLFVGAKLSLSRPSTTARLQIISPGEGEVFHGDPVTIPVQMRLEGGRVVATSSLRLVPNEGHIHLSLDGSLVAMTGLDAHITASPGRHELQAEFVAIDHGPFQPRVLTVVTFWVRR